MSKSFMSGQRPTAHFIPDIEAYMSGKQTEPTVRALEGQYTKFRFMEKALLQRKSGLAGRLPELNKALSALVLLARAADPDVDLVAEGLADADMPEASSQVTPPGAETGHFDMRFELAETLYAEGRIKTGAAFDTVHLWIGSNVMVAYPPKEALGVLRRNRDQTLTMMDGIDDDIAHIREQINILQVNVARIHNWDVKRRAALRQQAAK
ncbi:hypothetical protein H696_05981 [Fonticula alba]|uniref:Prefoldin subunit 3 n=1 Tax=Fonticula alba TaxID=691883 RepID=A0A058Z004_FONAL|nr:hypothetical protein H696_05981 [Fonticula alba]KCV67584.1 hypothetical protein H696_05981 [Fonticula alba]|eukprot:XP_009498025.1 hypothetical protein H696_05981 [Fonticula alba]